MANKKSSPKSGARPQKANRDLRYRRTINIIFLVISALLILAMILSAVVKF
jgi:hypothetical protein